MNESRTRLTPWEQLQYRLLRPLAHDSNRRSEEELDAAADNARVDLADAQQRVNKLLSRLAGQLEIDPQLSYLDVGCGNGDLACALIKGGAQDVTAIDIIERNIDRARSAASRALDGAAPPTFVCADIHDWEPPQRYDVVFSHEAMEHIDRPGSFIAALPRLMKPNGRAILAFGPLFHSYIGDHQWGHFRVQIPWRGVLFSEKVLMRLRHEYFRPTENSSCFEDMPGGLNRMRYSEFLEYVADAGLEFEFLSVNPQFKSIPPLQYISAALTRLPILRDYWAVSVYAILRHQMGT